MTRLFVALLLLASAPVQAQSVISQGMTPEQVRETFGAPATTRTSGEWTYWYYHNGCPNRCGSDDVVFFREERVVAAVLRTRARRFSGPRADDALGAAAMQIAPRASIIVRFISRLQWRENCRAPRNGSPFTGPIH